MNALSVSLPATKRNCGNCACFFKVAHPQNPLVTQGFCRRDPPVAQQVRVEVPRLKDGKTQAGKDGKPIMEFKQQLAYVFAMTAPEMVCFDGWRPEWTRPGDDWGQQWGVRAAFKALDAHFGSTTWDAGELLEALKVWAAGPDAAANDGEQQATQDAN